VNYIPIASRKLYLEMRQVTLQKPGPCHILNRLVSGKMYGLIINPKPGGKPDVLKHDGTIFGFHLGIK